MATQREKEGARALLEECAKAAMSIGRSDLAYNAISIIRRNEDPGADLIDHLFGGKPIYDGARWGRFKGGPVSR